MKSLRIWIVVLLASVALGSIVPVAVAQEYRPSEDRQRPAIPELKRSTEQWDNDELQQFAQLITSESISVADLAAIYPQLSDSQVERITEIIGEGKGIPESETRDLLMKRKSLADIRSCSGATSHAAWIAQGGNFQITSSYLWGCYRAEYAGSVIQNPTLSSSKWMSTECGTSDTDWNLQFDLWYYQDPDRLRWYTTSSQVYWSFNVAYGLNLNSFAYSYDGWSKAHLVAGQTAVSLAGGIDNVASTVYLGMNP